MSENPEDNPAENPWTLDYARHAAKDIARLDPPVRRRVLAALGQLAAEPRSGQLRKLVGHEGSRLRVGDWRVLLALDNSARTIRVQRVLPRGRAYDR